MLHSQLELAKLLNNDSPLRPWSRRAPTRTSAAVWLAEAASTRGPQMTHLHIPICDAASSQLARHRCASVASSSRSAVSISSPAGAAGATKTDVRLRRALPEVANLSPRNGTLPLQHEL